MDIKTYFNWTCKIENGLQGSRLIFRAATQDYHDKNPTPAELISWLSRAAEELETEHHDLIDPALGNCVKPFKALCLLEKGLMDEVGKDFSVNYMFQFDLVTQASISATIFTFSDGKRTFDEYKMQSLAPQQKDIDKEINLLELAIAEMGIKQIGTIKIA